MKDADIIFGLSAKGATGTGDGRGQDPIIFAAANPDPEITPEDALAVRPDAIIATGRSDYPEPGEQRPRFSFRGALDVRAKTINMK